MVTQIILILAGLFSLISAIVDWDWFMEARRVSTFVNLFGRNGARIFYGVLGIFLIGAGLFAS